MAVNGRPLLFPISGFAGSTPACLAGKVALPGEKKIIMRPNTVGSSGAHGRNRLFGALALVVVGAVLVCGVATLAGSALQAAEPGPALGVSSTPFTFDAPTANLQRFKPNEAMASAGGKTAQDALLLGDWKYTQTITPAEITFLALIELDNPGLFPKMIFFLLIPGVLDFLATLPPILQFITLEIIGAILNGGHNPFVPPAPPPPVSAVI